MRTGKQVSILGVILFIFTLTGCSETKKQTSAEKAQPDQAGKAAPMAQIQETQQIFEGELMKVDATAKTLSVKNLKDRKTSFDTPTRRSSVALMEESKDLPARAEHQ
jgi:hypothetical protein